MSVRDILYLCSRKSNHIKEMTGITAKRNSVSVPKTAKCCGLTLSAAIRRVLTSTGSPSAAIPDAVIIGDRGHAKLSAPFAPQAGRIAPNSASSVYTILLYINPQNLRQDDHRHHHHQHPQHHAKRRDGDCQAHHRR